ncbi:MAG: winged helix-turn-helix transcriptional regulator [Lachnospiraceae bacterium]|nr:winged helix-turn-helix transcriptional regulator [Lachnospiraceae bacterium]
MNYNATVPQDVTDNVTDKNDANIDEFIVKSIKLNSTISTSKIAENSNIPKRTILRHIDELKKKNVLRFVGESKNGHWELI